MDAHIVSKAGIDKDFLANSDRTRHYYNNVVQNFVYKKKGTDDSTAGVVPDSGFEISNSLTYNRTEHDWVHSVSKVPRDVVVKQKAARAGRGSAFGNYKTITGGLTGTGVSEIIRDQRGLELTEYGKSLLSERCRTETAVTRLARLRRRVRRFTQLCQELKTLCSTNLDNASTFLDDRLLPATSNAAERGNRRYRIQFVFTT